MSRALRPALRRFPYFNTALLHLNSTTTAPALYTATARFAYCGTATALCRILPLLQLPRAATATARVLPPLIYRLQLPRRTAPDYCSPLMTTSAAYMAKTRCPHTPGVMARTHLRPKRQAHCLICSLVIPTTPNLGGPVNPIRVLGHACKQPRPMCAPVRQGIVYPMFLICQGGHSRLFSGRENKVPDTA